jgi:Leu/Phe-tRNA-protein transferase
LLLPLASLLLGMQRGRGFYGYEEFRKLPEAAAVGLRHLSNEVNYETSQLTNY